MSLRRVRMIVVGLLCPTLLLPAAGTVAMVHSHDEGLHLHVVGTGRSDRLDPSCQRGHHAAHHDGSGLAPAEEGPSHPAHSDDGIRVAFPDQPALRPLAKLTVAAKPVVQTGALPCETTVRALPLTFCRRHDFQESSRDGPRRITLILQSSHALLF